MLGLAATDLGYSLRRRKWSSGTSTRITAWPPGSAKSSSTSPPGLARGRRLEGNAEVSQARLLPADIRHLEPERREPVRPGWGGAGQFEEAAAQKVDHADDRAAVAILMEDPQTQWAPQLGCYLVLARYASISPTPGITLLAGRGAPAPSFYPNPSTRNPCRSRNPGPPDDIA
jgi:hypothetical protein